jgi:hypothetical protein
MAEQSATNIEIVFEGSGVKTGTINARVLADALTGCSDLFSRANQILNGPDSRAVVLVEADFKRGSFVVDLTLVQEIVGQAMKLIEDYPYASALTLAVILGLIIPNKNVRDSLFGLIKSLKGEKPANNRKIRGTVLRAGADTVVSGGNGDRR